MNTPFLIDLGHMNNLPNDFADWGIAGVWQKATQGTGFVDPTYHARSKYVRAQDVPFAAFHFSTGQDVSAQVKNFLNVTGTGPLKRCLDWEESEQGIMDIEQAREFMQRVFDATGEWPDIYGSNLVTESPAATVFDPILSKCNLWLAHPIKGNGGLPRSFEMPTVELASWPVITVLQYSADEPGYCRPPFYVEFDGADFDFCSLDYLLTWP